MITFPSILLAVIAFISVYISIQIIYYKCFHPLRHYPGPFWAGVTSLWSAWHIFWGTETLECWEATKKWGPVIRVEPNLLMMAESSAIPKIYHRRATKGNFFPQEFFKKPGSIVIRDPFQHSAHRRLVASTYAMSNIQRMEPLITAHIVRWMDKIETSYAATRKPIDFAKWTTYLSYDTVTDLGFRSPIGFVESGKDINGLIRNFQLGLRVMGAAARVDGLLPFIASSWLGKRLQVGADSGIFFRSITQHALKILNKRTKSLEEGRTVKPQKGESSYDFLQAFTDTRTPDGELLSVDTILTEIFVILGAGADGFGSSCSSVLVEILSRPGIYARVINEIRTAVQAGYLSTPVPTYNEVAKRLPFYNACVSEALRLHPLAAMVLPRKITPLDPEMIVNGRKIPLGIEIASNPWICQRDKAIYGEDAEDYNPDRWLGDPEQVKMYEKYNLTFGGGTRVCLGKHFAMVMLYKAPVALFMRFDAILCPNTPETPKPFRRFLGPVLTWDDVWVKLTKRKPWVLQTQDTGFSQPA
ncbi:hypothetical protein BDV06DRAFT_233587 [Aspergillus oleicola]